MDDNDDDDDELILIHSSSLVVNDDLEGDRPMQSENGDVQRDTAESGTHVTDEEETTNSQQDALEDKKPFCYCRFVTKYPVTSFLLTLSIHVSLATVTGILILTGYNLFQTDFQGLPMELYNIPYKMRENAWKNRDDYKYKSNIYIPDAFWTRKEDYEYYNIELFYDTNGGNIFTKHHLKKIKDIEKEVMSTEEFDNFCSTINSSMICRKPESVIRFFDGTYAHIDTVFLDPEFENIHSVLYEAYSNNKTRHDFMYFLPESFTLSKTYSYAALTRSQIRVSWSEHNGMSTENFMRGIMKNKLQSLYTSVSEFDLFYMSESILFDDLQKQALHDAYFAVGSVCFIFVFILAHTRSLWITMWAVLSICTSYLGTNLIYRCILKYHYFGYFHLMVIFIIFGIGADDLFVFYDTWRLTSHKRYISLAHRLHDAYSKSMLSMLITSVTTAAAFFSSCSSPILATRSFGIFSGILVIINYISVIVFFPTVVIVYHVKLKQCGCCKSRCCKRNRTDSRLQDSQDVEDNMNGGEMLIPHVQRNRNLNETNNQITSDTHPENEIPNDIIEEIEHNTGEDTLKLQSDQPKKSKRIVRFVRDHYFRFITDRVMRWIIVLFFFMLVVFFSYQTSRLQTDNQELKFFVASHNYAKARERQENSFIQKNNDRYITVYVIWGLKLPDRSKCNFTSINCVGLEMFDDSFNPNPPENQLALKRFCDKLYSLSSKEIADLKIRRNSKTNEPEIACFSRNMEKFLKLKQSELEDTNLNLSLPWDSEKTRRFLTVMSKDVHTNQLNFSDYFDIPIRYWLTNGHTMRYTADYKLFNKLIGEQRTNFSGVLYDAFTGNGITYGNKIKYLAVLINTTIDQLETSFTDGIPVIERWEQFIQQEMDKMPPGLQGGFQFGYFEWHWLYVQQSLARNAIIGITLGVSLAFPIITIATMNVILGFLATLSICCTTVCVIGIIPLVGWKLGLLVSLNMCLVVGLSVDYVVHLAEGYHLSSSKDRISRTRDMLEAMGSPVIYGAVTTIGATVFMFFAKIQFFLQFATFMFCNIGFSFLFSLGFFTTMVGIFGPENDTGSVKKLCRCFKNCRALLSNKNYVPMERSVVI